MFGKTTIPQRKPFQSSVDEITQDINSICLDEEQRNKLYFCLDNKPPNEHHFAKVEQFLKGTDNLEDAKQELDWLIKEADMLIKYINEKVDEIRNNVHLYDKGKEEIYFFSKLNITD